MTQIDGTQVAAPVVPPDTTSVHPSHVDLYGKGGWRVVADSTERDAIPAPRRSVGMTVRTLSDGKEWVLAADLTTWTEHTSPPTAHTHVLADVTDAADALSAKLNLSGGTLTGDLILSQQSPGIWFVDTDETKSAYCLLDGNSFQLQRRNKADSVYEATVWSLDLLTGNTVFAGTATASGFYVDGVAAALVTDARFTDSRTPLAHAASHSALGSDPLSGYRLQADLIPWSDLDEVPTAFKPDLHSASHGLLGVDPSQLDHTQITGLGSLALIDDAPSDGKQYAREDGGWTEVTAGGYTLPTASATVLGGVKVGANLSIDGAGVLSATGGSGSPQEAIERSWMGI